LNRQVIEIITPFGKAPAKIIRMIDGSSRITPEYDWCRDIAKSQKLPIRKVYDIVAQLAEKTID
jgi:uncharacterized protein (DUF111 family)